MTQRQGSALVVSGESGTGKTALLRRLAAAAGEAGCRVLHGGGLGGELPLRTLLDAILTGLPGTGRPEIVDATVRAVLPLVPPSGRPVDGRSAELISRYLTVLLGQLADRTPVLLAVDDLHLADPTSLAVWPELVRAGGELPVLFAAAHPPSAESETPETPRAVGIRLGPLSATETRTLAQQVTGGPPGAELRERLRLADGNPRELLRLLDGSYGSRDGTGALGPAAVEALRAAAVLGDPAEPEELAAVLGISLAAVRRRLDEAARGGVLDSAGPAVRFRRPLVREALLRELPHSLCAAVHRQAARALADRGADPARVLAQLNAAGEPERWAAEWLARSVDFDALAERRHDAVSVLLERLFARLPESDPLVPELWHRLAVTRYRLGHPDTEPTVRAALARAVEPEHQATAAMLLSEVLLRRGDVPAGLGAVEAALARHTGQAPWAGRLLALRARVLFYGGRYVEAARSAETAAALGAAGREVDVQTVCMARQSLAWVLTSRRDPAAGLAAASEEPPLGPAEGPLDAEARYRLTQTRALLLSGLDRHAEARATLAHGRRLAEERGAVRALLLHPAAAVVLRFARGDWDGALTGSAVVVEHRFCGWSPIEAYGTAALIELHRGRRREAVEQLERWGDRPVPEGGPRGRSGALVTAGALLAERAGSPRDAVEVLAVLLEPEFAHDMDLRFLWLPELVRLALLADDRATARAALAAAEQECGRASGTEGPIAAAERCRGLLTGDPEPLAAAVDHYRRVGRPLEHAAALEDLAAVLALRGERGQARRRLTAALAGYRSLGAQWDISRAEARLRELGVRRGRPPGSGRGATRSATRGWESLTPAEDRIARLLIEGWSNPQIAAELLLSPRTVQTHVSHILAKLGLRSRGQVAREAARHGVG
ncbi:LuxR C-terminal-related transcriptional regulator [Kitasatospora sp. NPDC089509]|uniref:LuxR C-terminal-related transcriptional regulator n=1 Tax=Kitasatospora sp. NPDC089509 TaxID=3364079 RepID=UPI0037FA7344